MDLYQAFEHRLVAFFAWLQLDFYEVGLVFIACAFALVVYRLHNSDDAEFSFEELFTVGDRPGKADLFKLLAFGAFMAHTWVIVRSAAYSTLSEYNLSWYSTLWSGAYVVLKGFQTFSGKTPALPSATPPANPPTGSQ